MYNCDKSPRNMKYSFEVLLRIYEKIKPCSSHSFIMLFSVIFVFIPTTYFSTYIFFYYLCKTHSMLYVTLSDQLLNIKVVLFLVQLHIICY